ncbi:MAG: signal recognition particle-docking protein FtsY [Opitutae bacterium]|nr:signal recognition particle-docking protein FtsY [Opitutae bacterium]
MFGKLFEALGKSRSSLSNVLNAISKGNISNDDRDKLEEKLLQMDMGYDTVQNIIDLAKNSSGSDLNQKIKDILSDGLPSDTDWGIVNKPCVMMIVGVNGTGKTTSAAKLAKLYQKLGFNITLIAADTYRAAAIDQLKIWSDRIPCRLICNESTSDPASVIFDGLESASSRGSDITIIDTAGRLHTSVNLMSELEKMYRVIDSHFSQYSLSSYITLDATLGQNSLNQAEVFHRGHHLDGAILTKLDGTAKGGIIFPLFSKFKIPVKFLGMGEGLSDLVPFDREAYVNGLLGIGE